MAVDNAQPQVTSYRGVVHMKNTACSHRGQVTVLYRGVEHVLLLPVFSGSEKFAEAKASYWLGLEGSTDRIREAIDQGLSEVPKTA